MHKATSSAAARFAILVFVTVASAFLTRVTLVTLLA